MNITDSEVATPLRDPDPARIDRLVTAAIAEKEYAKNGASFAPFLVKIADPEDFVNGWVALKGNAISFYGEYRGDTGNFLPLGDFAAVNNDPIAETPILLLAPMDDHENTRALVHPTGFSFVADDSGSKNPSDIGYWWPTAPAGYRALGICVGFNRRTPDPEKYWCVKEDYLETVPSKGFWSDKGSGWRHHNGSLSVPTLSGKDPQDRKFRLTPTTLLSDQLGNLKNTSVCLVVDKLMLPVDRVSVPKPDYSSDYGQGTLLPEGLDKVAVLPSSMVVDPGLDHSSFYYLAAEPQWVCTKAIQANDGGTYLDEIKVGTQSQTSAGFRHTTSLTLGAEVGLQAGPLSAKATVSYTEEMQLTGSVVAGTDTEVTKSVVLNLEKADNTLIWQKQTNFVLYRDNGEVVTVVPFYKDETAFSYSNPK